MIYKVLLCYYFFIGFSLLFGTFSYATAATLAVAPVLAWLCAVVLVTISLILDAYYHGRGYRDNA